MNPMRISALAAPTLSVLFTACGGASGDASSTQASAPGLSPSAPAPAPGEGPAGSKNVAMYGARGDGVADDSAAIQAAIDAASSGEVVFLPVPANFYRISETIRVTKPLALLGAKSMIKSPTAACPTFIKITANDVQVQGLRLAGPQQACGYAIDVGSAGNPVSNVRIENNRIENFYSGITMIEVDGFRLAGNALSDMNYYGIQGSAVKNGVIDGNTVRGISGANTAGNAYGIVLSRNAASPSHPRSTDVIVSNNNVEDVPVWECYDTHGGQRIQFIDNSCKNAKLGINVAFSGKGQGDPDALAPLECEVRGNTIEKNPADPYRDAIVFAGTMTETATGSITGNVLIGFGSTGIYTVNANVIQTSNVRK